MVYEETIKKLLNQEQSLFNNNLVPLVDDNIDIDKMVKEYAASFVDMARLGFVSMDVDSEGRFCIIAEPKEGIPEEILEMLPEGWGDWLE